jgi:hypothetical protein
MCREFIIMINSDVFKIYSYSNFKGGAHAEILIFYFVAINDDRKSDIHHVCRNLYSPGHSTPASNKNIVNIYTSSPTMSYELLEKMCLNKYVYIKKSIIFTLEVNYLSSRYSHFCETTCMPYAKVNCSVFVEFTMFRFSVLPQTYSFGLVFYDSFILLPGQISKFHAYPRFLHIYIAIQPTTMHGKNWFRGQFAVN